MIFNLKLNFIKSSLCSFLALRTKINRTPTTNSNKPRMIVFIDKKSATHFYKRTILSAGRINTVAPPTVTSIGIEAKSETSLPTPGIMFGTTSVL